MAINYSYSRGQMRVGTADGSFIGCDYRSIVALKFIYSCPEMIPLHGIAIAEGIDPYIVYETAQSAEFEKDFRL